MTVSVYIDHPAYLGAYKYLPGEKTANEVVSRILGVRAKFLCNSIAQISKGDVYELLFDSHEDATIFVLKTKYTILNKTIVEEYKKR